MPCAPGKQLQPKSATKKLPYQASSIVASVPSVRATARCVSVPNARDAVVQLRIAFCICAARGPRKRPADALRGGCLTNCATN